ncbi:GYD domain-containing protein [Kaistia defluvii]|uniref:GYD domain-containing protein n=1 Tax=Kaistia defluvii TaxID=410841 RepID=UPI0022588534|nr:GYD domain-containing protein [Kaistia defluvii]MCX5517106.1 GYD domain-containing protein [Kaistia defluvii]
MAHYLLQVSYATNAVKAMVANPQNREDPARKVVESMGGKLHAFYFALGEFDVVMIAEFPDNVSAAAVSLATGATGALSRFETTALMTTADGMEAMRKAKAGAYSPPA